MHKTEYRKTTCARPPGVKSDPRGGKSKFLFRIPAKDTVVVFYITLSPQKCSKLNTEKQHAQGHMGSNLTPEGENRNFYKNVYHQQHKSTMADLERTCRELVT
jgi:hypothetical protein